MVSVKFEEYLLEVTVVDEEGATNILSFDK